MMRIEHDYHRRGALAYLAAWDVHRGQVIGRCEDTTGIEPFARLVDQVMTAEPYASADRVFWITDNGSSHRGQASIDRMATRMAERPPDPHARVHASWLDQAEIYFSVVQRKVVAPNDFTDLDQIRDPAGRVRDPLQRRRRTLQLALHPHRPRRPTRPPRRPRANPPRPGGLTPDELTNPTT